MAKKNSNKAVTVDDIRVLADMLGIMTNVLTEIRDALAPAEAEPEEPVQLTLKEYGEAVGKYYTPDELATLSIRANDADKFDIFDGDDIVLKDVSYRSYENGTRRSIWDMLGVAQSTFSHNYSSGKPFKMPDYGIRNGVVKMHRRRG